MAAILVLAPGADIADLRRRLAEQRIAVRDVLDRLGLMVVDAGAADLDRLRALPSVEAASLETTMSIGPGENPRLRPAPPTGPGLWTTPSKAVGASWRSPAWDTNS